MTTITKNAEDLTDFHSIANAFDGRPARVVGVLVEGKLIRVTAKPVHKPYTIPLVFRQGETVEVVI